jgi:MFS family permease
MLISASLLGIGIGLAFAALGNLIVQAVPSHQTGVASGMNTVMRTLGGALGGQLSATFISENMAHGLPTVTGFTETFLMATGFLILCFVAGLLIPGMSHEAASQEAARSDPLAAVPEAVQG